MKSIKGITSILGAIALCASFSMANAADSGSKTVTVKGEVVDLMCYLDHGAKGAKHAECAKMCINEGGPVGLKADNGTLYLVIGTHKPANAELAPYAAKQVTLKGKAVEKDGVHMLENIEIVK